MGEDHCGGTGYKKSLVIEHVVRDAKAGWIMGPTNEVLRQFVGKWALPSLPTSLRHQQPLEFL